MTTWQGLTECLTHDLMNLAVGDTIIIRTGMRYVQLRQMHTHTHGEASGNEFLPDGHRLTAGQELLLREHGWQDPDPGMVNWKLDLPWPATAQQMRNYAATLTGTLHTVFGAATPDDLRVQAWNDTSGEATPLALRVTDALPLWIM